MSSLDINSITPGRPTGSSGETPPARGASAADVPACWSDIGVQGNGTCPELKRYIHCRNCPVYSSAGVRLLDRPLPAGYRAEWTERLARQKPHAPQRHTAAVPFRIGAEWLALPALAFQEVAERRPIHSLPHRRLSIVLGLANVRGELLVCVSLGHWLKLQGLPRREVLCASYHRLLVANWQGSRFAFPADEIPSTCRLDLDELKDPPATVTKSDAGFIRGVFGWRGQAVGLLDAEAMFSALNRSLT